MQDMDKNDSENDKTTEMASTDADYQLEFNSTYLLEVVLYSVGFVLNATCSVIFCALLRASRPRASKSDMLRYLLVKSLLDSVLAVRNCLNYVFVCYYCAVNRHRWFKYLEILFYAYVGFAIQTMSLLCELFACFERCRTISSGGRAQLIGGASGAGANRCCCCAVASCPLSLGLAFLFCSLFYAYKFFEYRVVHFTSARNPADSVFLLVNSAFFYSLAGKLIRLMHSLIRDGVCVLLILALNVWSVLKLRAAYRSKRRIACALATVSITATKQQQQEQQHQQQQQQQQPRIRRKRESSPSGKPRITRVYPVPLPRPLPQSLSPPLSPLSPQGASATRNSGGLTRHELNEIKITAMMFLTSAITILGHGLVLAHYLHHSMFGLNVRAAVYDVGEFLFDLSYTINFFFYFVFINKFRVLIRRFVAALLFKARVGWQLKSSVASTTAHSNSRSMTY